MVSKAIVGIVAALLAILVLISWVSHADLVAGVVVWQVGYCRQ